MPSVSTDTPRSEAASRSIVHGELRLRRVVVDAHRVEAGPVLQRLAHLLRLVGERAVVGAGDGELQPLAAAADAEAVRLARGDLHAGDLLQPRIELLHDLLLRPVPLAPGRERQHHEAGIPVEGAGDHEDVRHLAALEQRLHRRLDLAELAVHVVDGDALRAVDGDRDEAAVLGRRELLGELRVGERRHAGEDERRRDHDGRRAERHVEQAMVEPLALDADGLDALQEADSWCSRPRRRAPSGCARRAWASASAPRASTARRRRP